MHGAKENKGNFCVPLNIDFFQTPVFLCPGINLKLKLVKNKDEFFLLSDGSKANIRIDDLSLRFRVVETSKCVLEDVTKVNVVKGNAYYPYYISKIITNLITQGIQSYICHAAIRGKLPKQIIVGFVDHSAYSFAFNENLFVFENFDINGLGLRINGVSFPSTPYKVDFTNGKYSVLHDGF